MSAIKKYYRRHQHPPRSRNEIAKLVIRDIIQPVPNEIELIINKIPKEIRYDIAEIQWITDNEILIVRTNGLYSIEIS